jgi:DNA-binding response OmpR family regulator
MPTILLVDDDPLSRDLVRLRLATLNCTVVEASNGIDAEQLTFEIQPDLILLDIMMPLQDGYTTCRNLRSKGFRGMITLVSVLPELMVMRNAIMCKADGYIQKPMSQGILERHIACITRPTQATSATQFNH